MRVRVCVYVMLVFGAGTKFWYLDGPNSAPSERCGTTLADMSVLLWGSAEVFDWRLFGQDSTLTLPVAAVKVKVDHFGRTQQHLC